MRTIEGLGQHLAKLLTDLPGGFELHVRPSRVDADARLGLVEVTIVAVADDPSQYQFVSTRAQRDSLRAFPHVLDFRLTQMLHEVNVSRPATERRLP